MPQHLPPVKPAGWPSSAYNLSVSSTGVVVTATTETGILAGTVTLLQASSARRGMRPESPDHYRAPVMAPVTRLTIPFMEVKDAPFREWRGLQLDLHGTDYHSIDLLKKYIRLARWYKLNVFTFNMGMSLWLSPVMKSSSLMNSTWRAGDNSIRDGRGRSPCFEKCVFYSPEEWDDLIAYGVARGVRLVPSTMGFQEAETEVITTLNHSMLPPAVGYKYVDWMDEIDGKGPSTCASTNRNM